ncbi:MAG: hypothetical protein JNL52_10900 [Flavobacteriales bacterium]|nr:hypothetical protein [Flavobacteriales bacterium]
MKRLPAFTLLESMTALLLLGIVGAMAITVVNHLQQGFRMGEDRVSEEEVLWLLYAFNADRDHSDGMCMAPNRDILLTSQKDTIRYGLKDGSVVRTRSDGRSAVFNVHALAVQAEPDGTGGLRRWTLVRDSDRMSTVHFVAAPSIADKRNAHAHTADTTP